MQRKLSVVSVAAVSLAVVVFEQPCKGEGAGVASQCLSGLFYRKAASGRGLQGIAPLPPCQAAASLYNSHCRVKADSNERLSA